MDVYSSFAQELLRQKSGQVSLLDEEDGLLFRWSSICEDNVRSLSPEMQTDEIESWALERNTWQLVRSLYTERLSESRQPPSPSREGSTSKNPYSSPFTVVQKLVSAQTDLVELSIIRDWLHSIPSSLNPAEIRRGYLPYTKNKLKQTRRTNALPGKGALKELDPDSVFREAADGAGGRLAVQDATYERALIRSLFEYVRAGELDLAIDMCRQSDQSWRAASLSGGTLYRDPALSSRGDGLEMEMEVGDDLDERAHGNANRRLWKSMCRKFAATSNLDPFERALYGAISGDTVSVLPVCSSWEDHVWAHVNALLESNVEAGLASSSEGRFWSRGTVDPIGLFAPHPDGNDAVLNSKAGGNVRKELEGVFDRLLRNDKGELGQAARSPFHVSQTFIILGNINDLFTTFVDRLEAAAADTEPETLSQLLRFFAHLVLVMRLLEQPVPELAANRIIEAYVKVLEATNQDETLIAFYASNLESDRAVESYAQFLLTFGPTSDPAARRTALLQTRDHGLDLAKIACRTVELTLTDVLMETAETEVTSTLDVYARLDERQVELIRSLEWLTIDPSTHAHALTQANALIRYFLASAKPHAARELLLGFPSDVLPGLGASIVAGTSAEGIAAEIKEYYDFVSFFECLENHTRYAETWSVKPRSSASKLDQTAFKDGIATLIDQLYSATVELLESEWLKSDIAPTDLDSHRKASELARIRQLYIPELILRLHFSLFDTRTYIPSNLQKTLDLAIIVADEKSRLYLEFITDEQNRIVEYLGLVRAAALVALDSENFFAIGR